MAMAHYQRSTMFNATSIALAMTISASVFAQTNTQSNTTEDDEQATSSQEVQQLDRIQVTGSRIFRAGFDTLEPATVINREYIEARGITNIADALNETLGFGIGATPEGGQAGFGVGVNFVNRFGLGTNRTLTLVNGRRFVSSNTVSLFGPAAPGVQVDLNSIPTSMVERVENLAVGGAPTYGADAIAGVVNIILRKDYEGAEVNFGYGITDQNDNERYNVNALYGTNFGPEERGNFTINVAFDDTSGVLQVDRDYFSAGFFNTTNPLASIIGQFYPGRTPANDGRLNPNTPFNTGNGDGIPNSVFIQNRRIWGTSFGGYIFPATGISITGPGNAFGRPRGFGANEDVYLGFDPNGNVVPYNVGSVFSSTDASGGDGFNLVEAGQITSDLTRQSTYSTARYSLTDSIDAFFEGSFYRAEAFELVDQYAYNSALFGGASAAIRIPTSHPLLTAQARQTLQGLGITSFNVSRASRDLVENNGRGQTDLSRVVFGLEGTFDIAERSFYWETSFNYGRSNTTSIGTSLIQQNFINALHVTTNAQGQVVCAGAPVAGVIVPGGGTPIPDANCVPLDIFGEGRPSAAARNYVTTRTEAESLLEQQIFSANLSGPIVELWSGPLEFSLGYERRKESGVFDPGDFGRQGLGRAVPITPLNGNYTTDEFYGEFIFPLINPDSSIPGLERLDIIGKYRSVDSTINGRANTYTYGLQWEPIEDLLLRGNFTRAIRAPSITELFLPVSDSFQFVTGDPCDSRFINAGGTRQAQRTANCQAFLNFYGISSFTSNAANASIRGTSGGNPALENEISDSITYGFTWAPSFLDGFTISADYYKIELDLAISSLTAAQLGAACFDNDDFNTNDIPNANSFCSRIVRNAQGSADPGQATTFTSGFVNGRFVEFEGYSTEIGYRFDTDDLGQFAFGLTGFFPRTLLFDVTGISPNPNAGEIGDSEDQFQLSGNWKYNKFNVGLQGNYYSSAKFNILNTPETREFLSVDAYWLFNGNVSYEFSDNLQASLSITNLADEEPPFGAFGLGIGTYDILGRRYFANLRWKF